MMITSYDFAVGQVPSDEIFQWWTKQMRAEKHMVAETPESLKASLLIALVAHEGETIIAAAGIFPARTKMKSEIEFDGKTVVELGSNFVAPARRGEGIGKSLFKTRVLMSRERGWIPVSVSSNPVMREIFRSLGGVCMDGDVMMSTLKAQLCMCEAGNASCNFCPLSPGNAWRL